jgi:hypothetical protein
MFRHRSCLVLFMCLVIATPLLAFPARKEAPRAPAHLQATALSEKLAWVWQHLTALWEAEGCGIDPDGKPQCASAPSHTAVALPPEGCGIDPNGCSR